MEEQKSVGKMKEICYVFNTFTDPSLEKLYQSFSVKQKRTGLECFLITAILFDIYMLVKRPRLDRMFASTSQRNDDGLRASYNISLLIAKSRKPHTIGEKLILPAVEEVLKTVLHKPASDIIKRIPLSNNTVERRIDEMSCDIESFLCNYLQTTHFSIQLDESTLPDNAALLLAYVRFIMNQEIYEELLFARTLIIDTKDFESRFEDILTMVIPPWIINPYGDIEETNVIIEEELTELSTNVELKVQFKNGYQQFWLQNNIPVTYPKNEVTSRDSLGWVLLLDYLIYVTLPIRLRYCVILSLGTCASYIVAVVGLSKSNLHLYHQVSDLYYLPGCVKKFTD
ncbi:unnamed protein product [Acanthoscelides obtectus]|uniref:Zinc finger BED domain-containing protein 5 n=1 Tax=Acanthoscelides obtectus TaxID=200917 RepID=A0A9P0MLY9_ACAOB|nr:unnamed protein product [Acanthoscelides obtectus]CAK1684678.1 SCAN domain-containing protein 3 [Acanthoscelides obtectus]